MPASPARGRHAPPLEVRLGEQRRRLFTAAAEVLCREGYADTTAEAITRAAGMSKATFYEHFANKEECVLALFDEAATEVLRAIGEAAEALRGRPYDERVAAGVRAVLGTMAEHARTTQTLLVESVGAGARARGRRDAMLDAIAAWLHRDNAKAAEREGAPRFVGREDADAVVGATVELVTRALRRGRDPRGLEPVVLRTLLHALRA